MKPVEYYLDKLEPFFTKNSYSNSRFDRNDCIQEQRLAVINKYRKLEEEEIELEEGQLIYTFTKRAQGAVKTLLCKQAHHFSFTGYTQYNKNKDSLPDVMNEALYVAGSGVEDDVEGEMFKNEILDKFDQDDILLHKMNGETCDEISKRISDIEKQIPLHCYECGRLIANEEIYYNKDNVVIDCSCGWGTEIKIKKLSPSGVHLRLKKIRNNIKDFLLDGEK